MTKFEHSSVPTRMCSCKLFTQAPQKEARATQPVASIKSTCMGACICKANRKGMSTAIRLRLTKSAFFELKPIYVQKVTGNLSWPATGLSTPIPAQGCPKLCQTGTSTSLRQGYQNIKKNESRDHLEHLDPSGPSGPSGSIWIHLPPWFTVSSWRWL